MILRTTYLKLTDEHRGERARHRLATSLRLAYANLPRVRGTEVAIAADAAALKGWDLAVHLRFDSDAACSAFEADAETLAVQADHLDGAVDFEKTWRWELT